MDNIAIMICCAPSSAALVYDYTDRESDICYEKWAPPISAAAIVVILLHLLEKKQTFYKKTMGLPIGINKSRVSLDFTRANLFSLFTLNSISAK